MRLRQAVSRDPLIRHSYADIIPITSPIRADRQGAKRHYGVHPYFTRRPYNVVRKYVLHYSRERDVVLDPFGGSGVTAIEAFLENRVGIQNDINPLANFIAESIAGLEHGTVPEYKESLDFVQAHSQEPLRKVQTAKRTAPRSFAEESQAATRYSVAQQLRRCQFSPAIFTPTACLSCHFEKRN